MTAFLPSFAIRLAGSHSIAFSDLSHIERKRASAGGHIPGLSFYSAAGASVRRQTLSPPPDRGRAADTSVSRASWRGYPAALRGGCSFRPPWPLQYPPQTHPLSWQESEFLRRPSAPIPESAWWPHNGTCAVPLQVNDVKQVLKGPVAVAVHGPDENIARLVHHIGKSRILIKGEGKLFRDFRKGLCLLDKACRPVREAEPLIASHSPDAGISVQKGPPLAAALKGAQAVQPRRIQSICPFEQALIHSPPIWYRRFCPPARGNRTLIAFFAARINFTSNTKKDKFGQFLLKLVLLVEHRGII